MIDRKIFDRRIFDSLGHSFLWGLVDRPKSNGEFHASVSCSTIWMCFSLKSFHLYLYGPDCGPIESSFEEAAGRLQSLQGLYLEPDGSFVWSKKGGAEQVYGMLYDAANKLQYVELWGDCQRAIWQQIVQAIRGDATHDLAVMVLPERQLQDLQGFEETAFC
jgi:hypothetical protein